MVAMPGDFSRTCPSPRIALTLALLWPAWSNWQVQQEERAVQKVRREYVLGYNIQQLRPPGLSRVLHEPTIRL